MPAAKVAPAELVAAASAASMEWAAPVVRAARAAPAPQVWQESMMSAAPVVPAVPVARAETADKPAPVVQGARPARRALVVKVELVAPAVSAGQGAPDLRLSRVVLGTPAVRAVPVAQAVPANPVLRGKAETVVAVAPAALVALVVVGPMVLPELASMVAQVRLVALAAPVVLAALLAVWEASKAPEALAATVVLAVPEDSAVAVLTTPRT